MIRTLLDSRFDFIDGGRHPFYKLTLLVRDKDTAKIKELAKGEVYAKAVDQFAALIVGRKHESSP